MEYLLGSIVTLASVILINKIVRRTASQGQLNFQITQSYLFKLLSEYNDKMVEDKAMPDTQSYKHIKNQYVRIMIVEDEAYWIKDNQLYVAKFEDGTIDTDSTTEVDTMSMSKVELEKTMFIVETLREEN